MMLTWYSLCMALLTGSLLCLASYGLCHWRKCLCRIGTTPIIVLSCGAVFRFLVPIEFSEVHEISLPIPYNGINNFLKSSVPESTNQTFIELFLLCWFFVAMILVTRFLIINLSLYRMVRSLPEFTYPNMIPFTKEQDFRRMRIVVSKNIETPHQIGFFRCTIISPDCAITEEELRFIISHEYQHYLRKDSWIKLLLHMLSILYWWNPCAKLLLHINELTSEILCDQAITEKMEISTLARYCRTLLKFSPTYTSKNHLSSGLTRGKKLTVLRYEVLLSHNSQNHQRNVALLTGVILLILLIFSYSFIFQSWYSAPSVNNSVNVNNDMEIQLDNTVVVNEEIYMLLPNASEIINETE